MAVKHILNDSIIEGTNSIKPSGQSSFINLEATVGTWSEGILTNPGTNAMFVRYTPNDVGTTSWYQSVGSFANSPGPRRNQTMNMGWNLGPGGGREVGGALNGALGIGMEQYYETVGPNKVMEFHNFYIAPNDVQTRFISMLGNLESPYNTGLYIYSTSIVLGSGVNNNDPPNILINSTNTQVQAPDGYARALFDNAGSGVTIANGSGANNDKGHIVIGSSGGIVIDTEAQTRLTYNDAVMIEVDSSSVTLTSQDGVTTGGRIQLPSGTGPILYAAGAAKLLIQSGQVYSPVPIRNETDGLGTNSQTVGLSAINNTAAVNGAQQYSPALELRGTGYKSDSGGASQADGWYIQARPVQGTAASSVNLVFGSSINEAAPTTRMTLYSDGFTETNMRYAATVGTLTEGPNLQGVDSTNSNFIKYIPNDASTTSWYQWASSFANAGARRNQVMRFGWNVSGGGGRVNTDAYNGALASEYEQYFEGGHNQMERHETFVDTDGYQTRWLSFEGHLDDGTTALYTYATNIVLGSGRTSNDQAQVVVNPGNTRVYSPNGFDYFYTDNDQLWLQTGTTATATSKLTMFPNGDFDVATVRGFLKGGSDLLAQWQSTGGSGGLGRIWLRSPDDSAEVYVDNGGLQLIAGGISALRHTGTDLSLNNGTAGITMKRSGIRSFQFGDATNATKIYGPDDLAYLSLASGVTGALLADVNEKIAAATGAGIIFTTNNIERARFDYSAFRPSTDATYKNGDSGARWSQTWTQELVANTITLDGYSFDAAGSVEDQALVYNATGYVPQTIAVQKSNTYDFLITTTSATDVLSFTPTVNGNYLVNVYYRVITAATDVTIAVSWTDETGAQSIDVVPFSAGVAVGSYTVNQRFISAKTTGPVKVTVTAGTANQLYISANITSI